MPKKIFTRISFSHKLNDFLPLLRGCGSIGALGLLSACPMFMAQKEHSDRVIECDIPGGDYHAAMDFNTTCWENGASRLILHGKLPDLGATAVSRVEIAEGPARAFTANLQFNSCLLTLHDSETGIECDFAMPTNDDPKACRGSQAEPVQCDVHLKPTVGTAR